MRTFLTRLGFAAAVSLGLAGAAAAAPSATPATSDGQVSLAKDVPVAWARGGHGHHYGWRHHRGHSWHVRRHARHYGWHHGRHRGWGHAHRRWQGY